MSVFKKIIICHIHVHIELSPEEETEAKNLETVGYSIYFRMIILLCTYSFHIDIAFKSLYIFIYIHTP